VAEVSPRLLDHVSDNPTQRTRVIAVRARRCGIERWGGADDLVASPCFGCIRPKQVVHGQAFGAEVTIRVLVARIEGQAGLAGEEFAEPRPLHVRQVPHDAVQREAARHPNRGKRLVRRLAHLPRHEVALPLQEAQEDGAFVPEVGRLGDATAKAVGFAGSVSLRNGMVIHSKRSCYRPDVRGHQAALRS
jgi:hypothetical protein